MSSDMLSTCAQVVDSEVRGDAVLGLYVHLYGVSGTGVVEAIAAEYCQGASHTYTHRHTDTHGGDATHTHTHTHMCVCVYACICIYVYL